MSLQILQQAASRSGRSPGEENGKPTPGFLPGESHGRRSLAEYSPWDCKELDMTATNTLSSNKAAGANRVAAGLEGKGKTEKGGEAARREKVRRGERGEG